MSDPIEDGVARLLRETGPRPAVPPERAARVKDPSAAQREVGSPAPRWKSDSCARRRISRSARHERTFGWDASDTGNSLAYTRPGR